MRAFLRAVIDRLLWWWGFWRRRTRRYATGKQLRAADERARLARAYVAHVMNNAVRKRGDHRDLLTGVVAALRHGPWPARNSRPGMHLRKRSGLLKTTPRKLVGRPVVYERNHVRVGETAFTPEYTPRAEQLAERRDK